MEQENLLIADPYNEQHLDMIVDFEKRLNNGLPMQVSDILYRTTSRISKEQYLEKQKNSDRFEENLYLNINNSLVSSCYVEGSRSSKSCEFMMCTPWQDKDKGYEKELLPLACDYVVDKFGVDVIKMVVPIKDEQLNNNLLQLGFVISEVTANHQMVYIKNTKTDKKSKV